MLSQSFAVNITVTGEKVHSFLRCEVCGRKRKNDGSKAIGYSTVRQYGTACLDLYKQQKTLNMNANPHPWDFPSLNVLSILSSQMKVISTKKFLKTEELVPLKRDTYLWKNCQGLPIIFCMAIPPSALALVQSFSSHIFVWWGESLWKDWSWHICSFWILKMKVQLNVRQW